MTSNNASVGKPSRTPDDVLAGLEAVRAECLRTISGDPLATWADVPPNHNPFLPMRGSAKVEFHTATLVPLMAEAVEMLRRSERRANDAEEALYGEVQVNESLTLRNDNLERDVAVLRRALGIAPNEVLSHWMRANRPDLVNAGMRERWGRKDSAGGDDGPRMGDTFTDAEGHTWTVTGFASDGEALMLTPGAVLSVPISEARERWGPLKPSEDAVSASETSSDGGTPEDGGEAVTRPYTPTMGDFCTDRHGDLWEVRRTMEDGTVVLRCDSHRLQYESEFVAETWGPLVWRGTAKPTGTVSLKRVAAKHLEDTAGPYVPAVGETCTDRDGVTWTVCAIDSGGDARFHAGPEGTMQRIAEEFGPLVWKNGQETDNYAGARVLMRRRTDFIPDTEVFLRLGDNDPVTFRGDITIWSDTYGTQVEIIGNDETTGDV